VSALEKDDKVIFPDQGEEKLTKVEPQVNASERKLSIKTDSNEVIKFHALQTGLTMSGVYSSRPHFFKRRQTRSLFWVNAWIEEI